MMIWHFWMDKTSGKTKSIIWTQIGYFQKWIRYVHTTPCQDLYVRNTRFFLGNLTEKSYVIQLLSFWLAQGRVIIKKLNEIFCVPSWEEIEMLRTYKVRKGSQPRQVDMTPSLGKGGSSSNELINLKYIYKSTERFNFKQIPGFMASLQRIQSQSVTYRQNL